MNDLLKEISLIFKELVELYIIKTDIKNKSN